MTKREPGFQLELALSRFCQWIEEEPAVCIQLPPAYWLPIFTARVNGTIENLVRPAATCDPIMVSISLFAASFADCILEAPPALEPIEPELSMTRAIS